MTTKSKLAGLVISALIICCAGTQQQCLAQHTNYLDMLKDIYSFNTWAGQTKARYERLVTNWTPNFASLGVTNFLWRQEGLWDNSQKYSRYSFHPSDSMEVIINYAIDEREGITNAHLAMIQFFSNCEAWQPFPLGSSLGVDVGDRCYVGWGVLSSVFFVRNNVFVSVSSHDGGYSVIGFAEKLDSELAARSFTGPVLLQAGISDGAFHVSVPTAPGKTYVLESKNSLTGTNWATPPSFTGDGTIRRVIVPAGYVPQRFYRLRVQ